MFKHTFSVGDRTNRKYMMFGKDEFSPGTIIKCLPNADTYEWVSDKAWDKDPILVNAEVMSLIRVKPKVDDSYQTVVDFHQERSRRTKGSNYGSGSVGDMVTALVKIPNQGYKIVEGVVDQVTHTLFRVIITKDGSIHTVAHSHCYKH